MVKRAMTTAAATTGTAHKMIAFSEHEQVVFKIIVFALNQLLNGPLFLIGVQTGHWWLSATPVLSADFKKGIR